MEVLYNRAARISTSYSDRKNEEKRVFEALQCNGYPSEFLLSVANNIKRKETNTNNSERAREERNTKGLGVLPYVAGTTERIKKVLVRNDIQVAMRPLSTIQQCLMHPKDRKPNLEQTGVFYSIPCKDCEIKYLGETGYALDTRTKEHYSSVKNEKIESPALRPVHTRAMCLAKSYS